MQPALPYRMPETLTGQIDFLRQLVGLPHTTFNSYQGLPAISDEVALEILTGIVLYHHLHHHEKNQVMRLIHDNLEGRPALVHAIEKITDPIVNPAWGLWSRKTTDLEKDLEFKESIATIVGLAGGGFSIPSLYNLVRNRRSTGASVNRVSRGHPVLMALIWGFYYSNDQSRKAIQEELVRRAGRF